MTRSLRLTLIAIVVVLATGYVALRRQNDSLERTAASAPTSQAR